MSLQSFDVKPAQRAWHMFVYRQPLQTTGAYAVLHPHPPPDAQLPACDGRAESCWIPRQTTKNATTKMGMRARSIRPPPRWVEPVHDHGPRGHRQGCRAARGNESLNGESPEAMKKPRTGG